MKKLSPYFSTLLPICCCLLLTTQTIAKSPQSDRINPALKAQFSSEISTESEMYKKADATANLYFACFTETLQAIQSRFPDAQQDMVIDVVNMTCEIPEDWFSLYNVLLASYRTKNTPISEQDAAVYLDRSYMIKGRATTNAIQRKKLYKAVGIIKD